MGDVVHFGLKSPVMGGATTFHLKLVAAARRSRQPRILWMAIFVKAIAIAARRRPELRQCFIPFPWPHIYEHPESVIAAVIEREWRGSNGVFFDHLVGPDRQPLASIDAAIRGLMSWQVEAVGGYRRLIRITRLPLFIRRLIWRFVLYFSGRVRSRYIGTASVNSLPVRGATVLQSTTPLTLSIFFSPLKPNGEMEIQTFFDHRVIDGMDVNRLLKDLEATLNGEIADELRQMAEAERTSAGRNSSEAPFAK